MAVTMASAVSAETLVASGSATRKATAARKRPRLTLKAPFDSYPDHRIGQ